jgi:hypothetical protein
MGFLMPIVWLILVFSVVRLRQRRAVPLLDRWARQEGLRVIRRRGFRYFDEPPHFAGWPRGIFRVTVEDAQGVAKEGWVRLDDRGALVVWDSGRIEETCWNESPKSGDAARLPVLWDRQLDG